MPKREMGLMGYVAEAVVEQWLRRKYPRERGYSVVQQLRPIGIPATGGPYIDFGITKDAYLYALYEVKGQDYIMDKAFKLNSSLLFVWSKKGERLRFASQSNRILDGLPDTQAYLVALVGPNEEAIANFGQENIGNIILFSEVWQELGHQIDENGLMSIIGQDIPKVLEILKNPTQGKIVNRRFLDLRSSHR